MNWYCAKKIIQKIASHVYQFCGVALKGKQCIAQTFSNNSSPENWIFCFGQKRKLNELWEFHMTPRAVFSCLVAGVKVKVSK